MNTCKTEVLGHVLLEARSSAPACVYMHNTTSMHIQSLDLPLISYFFQNALVEVGLMEPVALLGT